MNNLDLQDKNPNLTPTPGGEELFIMPASSGQQRLWFLDQLEPDSAAYNISSTHKIMGPLEVAVLTKTVQAIMRRHEILRTTFTLSDGQPMQIIHPEPLNGLEIISVKSNQDQTELIQAYTTRPFDLESGPLFRPTLVQLGPEEHLLILVMHHIISDGWSIGVLYRELAQFYDCLQHDAAFELSDLPLQYADYAVYQQEVLESPAIKAQLAYWQGALTELPPRLNFPTDPVEEKPTDSLAQLTISSDLMIQIQQLAQTQNSTVYMTLMAAFQLLLHRITGQEAVVVGSPVAGRNQAELEELIGFFLNTLPILTRFDHPQTFAELLEQVRQTTVSAFANQDVPFERIVDMLGVERDVHRHPIFDVMLNYANAVNHATTSPFLLKGLTIETIALQEPESKLSMTLYVEETAAATTLHLLTRRDSISAKRAQLMLAQFNHLLTQITTDPEQNINAYSLVTPETRPLLPDPTEALTLTPYPLLDEALAQIVTRQPTHPAIRQNEKNWSYAQLWQVSESIAHYLVAEGVQKGDVVAICGPRSFGLIAAMIGVMRSGGVILTLDQTLPRGRQEIMLAAAKTRRLIYLGTYRSRDGWMPDVLPITAVDSQTGLIDTTTAIESGQLPDLSYADPAYLFFTSGTTGTPKGVLGSHKGLAHFLAWQRQTFNIGPEDRSAQLTGLSFDVVLRDIFTPLTGGATLCLPNSENGLAPAVVLPWMEKEKITMLHSVPSLAQTWLAYVPEGVTLQSLRLIFSAGEPLMDTFIHQWRQAFPLSGQFINIYGPTETTLAKCYFPVPDPPFVGIQPVGKTLPDTHGLILNQAGQLCGIGEPGEIVIRTPFRSFGYINAPKQQAKQFKPNPFTNNPDDVVYHTGDLGRYRPDGTLEILGRVDHQIKIRGVRIELGEISYTIESHPAIKQTAVLAREDSPGAKYLAAYLVPQPGQTVDIAELRRWLRQRLADAMIPTSFIIMEALPITANGKLDRKSLPVPELLSGERKRPLIPPTTPTEQKLVEIWETLLEQQPIGIEDSFFDLGGHSLLAVHLFAQISSEFGQNLPLASLFQDATIRHLANLLDTADAAPQTGWNSLVPIQPEGEAAPFFCVHGITGDILWFRDLGQLIGATRPFYGLQSRGLDGMQEPFKEIPAMADHYIKAIKRIQPQGPYFIGGASFGGTVALEMARQFSENGDEVGLLVIFDHAPPNVVPLEEMRPSISAKAIQFASNFPRWLGSFLQLGPKAMIDRIRRKLRLVGKQPPPDKKDAIGLLEAADIIDYAHELPAHRRQIIEANFHAIDQFKPQPWFGPVLLCKARSRSLFVRTDPVIVWHQLVGAQNLEVVDISGSHEGIFHPPHVQKLAEILRHKLNQLSQKDQAAPAPEALIS